MKFAFSTLAGPDLSAGIARAKEFGYDGIELASPPSDTKAARAGFDAAGIGVAAVAAPAGIASLDGLIRSATELGAGLIRLPAPSVAKGQNPGRISREFAGEIAPFADAAGTAGIVLAVENTPPFATASALWTLLETIDHPAVVACYNATAGSAAAESPSVGVPTLNVRIQMVCVAAPAEGDSALAELLKRLRGIGYAGWVSVQGSSQTGDGLGEALARMRAWIKPPAGPVKQAAGSQVIGATPVTPKKYR